MSILGGRGGKLERDRDIFKNDRFNDLRRNIRVYTKVIVCSDICTYFSINVNPYVV